MADDARRLSRRLLRKKMLAMTTATLLTVVNFAENATLISATERGPDMVAELSRLEERFEGESGL
jgi:hypothetical protein